MLDHLYYLSLFQDYQGTHFGKVILHNRRSTSVTDYQNLVLEDLRDIFCAQSGLLSSERGACLPPKTSLVSCLLRYFDFINDIEQHLVEHIKQAKKQSKQQLAVLRQISLGK